MCLFQLCHELDQSGLNRAGLLREASRPAKPSAGGRGRLEGRELGPVEAPGDGGEALAWVYQYFSYRIPISQMLQNKLLIGKIVVFCHRVNTKFEDENY